MNILSFNGERNDQVALNEQLERKQYLDVKKVLETFGGKYVPNAKIFQFQYNLSQGFLDSLEKTIEENPNIRKELQFFPTPDSIAQEMFCALHNSRELNFNTDWVLEPSCGHGALLNVLSDFKLVQANDVSQMQIEIAKIFHPTVSYGVIDFLEFKPKDPDGKLLRYDVIMMNPPYTKMAYIDHVLHAYHLLAPGGAIVALVPQQLNTSAKGKQFEEFLSVHGNHYCNFDGGEFNDTNIGTRIITFVK